MASDIKCPICGNKTALRTRRSDKLQFYVCVNFPKCKGMVAQDDVYWEEEHNNDQSAEVSTVQTPQHDTSSVQVHKTSNGITIFSVIIAVVGLIVLPYAAINSQISINDRTIPYTHGDYVTYNTQTYCVYIRENCGDYYLNGCAYLVNPSQINSNNPTPICYLDDNGQWIDPTGVILVPSGGGSHKHWTDWKTIGILILPMTFLLIAFICSRVGMKRARAGASLYGLALTGFILSAIGSILWVFCLALYLNAVL